MARKRVQEGSVEDQLKMVEEKLARYRKYTADLEKEREELLARKQKEDFAMLYQYMQENHISIPEVLAVLSAKPALKV